MRKAPVPTKTQGAFQNHTQHGDSIKSPEFRGKCETQAAMLLALISMRPHHTYELRRRGVAHPASRIYDLDKRGYVFSSDRITTVDSEGFAHRGVALYSLLETPFCMGGAPC